MQRRGEIIETLPLLQEGADPAPRGPAATVSGQGAQECLSLYILHTVGTRNICRGHAGLWLGLDGILPCPASPPSPQPAVATLFQFLQTWNVSVYHQCQPDSKNLQPREACWGLPGDRGLSGGNRPPREPPAPFTIRYVGDPNPGTWPLWAMESSNQVVLCNRGSWVLAARCPGSQRSLLAFLFSRRWGMMGPPPRSCPFFWAFDDTGLFTCRTSPIFHLCLFKSSLST